MVPNTPDYDRSEMILSQLVFFRENHCCKRNLFKEKQQQKPKANHDRFLNLSGKLQGPNMTRTTISYYPQPSKLPIQVSITGLLTLCSHYCFLQELLPKDALCVTTRCREDLTTLDCMRIFCVFRHMVSICMCDLFLNKTSFKNHIYSIFLQDGSSHSSKPTKAQLTKPEACS